MTKRKAKSEKKKCNENLKFQRSMVISISKAIMDAYPFSSKGGSMQQCRKKKK
ncbi:hypothetical protein Hanom_Chr10g00934391 [Helianthus anomalus]